MRGPVMIVDDDPDTRDSVAQLFEDQGVTTLRADNGQRALDLLGETPTLPCVIVLDLLMPVMDGFEFLRKRQQDPRLQAIPVVVVSASTAALEREEVKQVDHVFAKPFDIPILDQVVKQYCGRD